MLVSVDMSWIVSLKSPADRSMCDGIDELDLSTIKSLTSDTLQSSRSYFTIL